MRISEQHTFGELLKQFRVREHLSQQEVATQIGVHRNTIVAWEQGNYLPKSRPIVQTLADVLRLNERDTDMLLRACIFNIASPSSAEAERPSLSSLLQFWNVPHPRNPLFTGRETIIRRLHSSWQIETTATVPLIQALCGLAGIGKTQTAVEYSYRYRHQYQAVLWAEAESREVLTTAFLGIATQLNLSEEDEQDQQHIIKAVKRWLAEHSQWLLILDNIDDVALVRDFLPVNSAGHVLLTTHAQSTGKFAHCIDLEKMELAEGALFLLRRAKRIAPNDDLHSAAAPELHKARHISQLMDGLPLALDQAGAYIEETECGLADYLDRYQRRRASLLARRGGGSADYPLSVSATFSFAIEKIEGTHHAAADLLRLCAFLHPDAIPQDLLTEGAIALMSALQAVVEDPMLFDEAIAVLRTYSLIRRNSETRVVMIHRLVQAVLRDRMEKEAQRQWAEMAVRLVSTAFPLVGEGAAWAHCQRYLPHAQVSAALIERWGMQSIEAAQLLHRAGVYLTEQGRYAQAETYLMKSYTIRQHLSGDEHPDVAESLNSLGKLFRLQGKYAQAESLIQQALEIRGKTLGEEHPYVGFSLRSLATIYLDQRKYAEAEPLYRRALAILDKAPGCEDADVAATLNNLANLYLGQERYAEAEPLYRRALAVYEKVSGPEHSSVSTVLNNLACLYHRQASYERAEALYQRALGIWEKALGTEHPRIAATLNNLALLSYNQGKYAEAELLYQRALTMWEKTIGSEHPRMAMTLYNLALLSYHRGQYSEAESLYQRAATIREMFDTRHSPTIERLQKLVQPVAFIVVLSA